MEITRSNSAVFGICPRYPAPIGTSDIPKNRAEQQRCVILRLTIVLRRWKFEKSTHRDAKLGSNERITRSARIRSFWTSPVEETKTRIVFDE